MAFSDGTELHDYSHPSWGTNEDGSPKSVVHFRKDKLVEDSDAVRKMAFVEKTEPFNIAKFRAAKRKGEEYSRQTETEQKRNVALCLFEVMCEGWEGPEFVLKPTFRDKTQPKGPDGKYPIHALAGQPVPPTAEWFGKLTEPELEDMESVMNRVWAGATADERDAFRDAVDGVDGSHAGEPAVRPGDESDGVSVSDDPA